MLISGFQRSCQITLLSVSVCVGGLRGGVSVSLLWGCLLLVFCVQWLQGGREPRGGRKKFISRCYRLGGTAAGTSPGWV